MLHIVNAIVTAKLTQGEAKKVVKLAGSIVGKSAKVTPELAEKFGDILTAYAKDSNGTYQATELGSDVFITILTGLDMKSVKGLKADLDAFLTSEEFKGLPATVKAARSSAAMVKPDELLAKLDDMTVREFRQYMTAAGGKFTLDRGVSSVKMPDQRRTAYFGQDGRLLDMGDNSKDSRKAVLDREHAKGKLVYLASCVKYTASQVDFIAECRTDKVLADYITPRMVKAIESKHGKQLSA